MKNDKSLYNKLNELEADIKPKVELINKAYDDLKRAKRYLQNGLLSPEQVEVLYKDTVAKNDLITIKKNKT